MSTKTICYIRVSTDRQAREGFSLDAQRARLLAYCDFAGLANVEVIADEGISAASIRRRPGMTRALAMLKKGEAAALVVVKLDRAFRNLRDAIDVCEAANREGWAFHSVSERLDTSSAVGRFAFALLAALGAMEREQIGERVSAAFVEVRAQGRKTGGSAPFGFDVVEDADGKRLVPNDAEQAVCREIADRHAAGDSLGVIARALNARGIATKGGGAWKPVQVKRVLESKVRAEVAA